MEISKNLNIVVLGASGMLGYAVFRYLNETGHYTIRGTIRSNTIKRQMPAKLQEMVIDGIDVEHTDSLIGFFSDFKPDVVINCVGLVKQLDAAQDPLIVLPINSLLPHRLAALCKAVGARLIHFSTDCVFSGNKGMYREDDTSDADDLYGRSKFFGEVAYPHCLTLRTSIIGHELIGSRSLVGWFLSQTGAVDGYDKAIFSGLPTVEIAKILVEFVLPNKSLAGLYHLSAKPINKYELLLLIAKSYGKDIEIRRNSRVVIDRSLDSSQFRNATNYVPPSWLELIERMREFE